MHRTIGSMTRIQFLVNKTSKGHALACYGFSACQRSKGGVAVVLKGHQLGVGARNCFQGKALFVSKIGTKWSSREHDSNSTPVDSCRRIVAVGNLGPFVITSLAEIPSWPGRIESQ